MARALATPLGLRRPRASTLRRVLGPEWALGWLLVSPVVLIVTTLLIYPFMDSIALSFQSRFSYTATPNLSLQFYGEPFVTTGRYTKIRELDAPRSSDYGNRFKPYNLGEDAGGFNEKQFNSNMVLRWEYRPGSTLFVVWSQGRLQDDRHLGVFVPGRDYKDLFSSRPDNTFLVKASYWFSL